jgi:hypothetical protein
MNRISQLIILRQGAIFMRPTNHLAQDKGPDFNQTEGPRHE